MTLDMLQRVLQSDESIRHLQRDRNAEVEGDQLAVAVNVTALDAAAAGSAN